MDPGRVSDFFDALGPYLYPPNRLRTATAFPVATQQRQDGRWVTVRVKRKFIELLALKDARELYAEILDKQRRNT